MVGCYHQLNGHEFEQTPGDGKGQGSLACCSPWGHKELDTTELLSNNRKEKLYTYIYICITESLFTPETNTTIFQLKKKRERERTALNSFKECCRKGGIWSFTQHWDGSKKDRSNVHCSRIPQINDVPTTLSQPSHPQFHLLPPPNQGFITEVYTNAVSFSPHSPATPPFVPQTCAECDHGDFHLSCLALHTAPDCMMTKLPREASVLDSTDPAHCSVHVCECTCVHMQVGQHWKH